MEQSGRLKSWNDDKGFGFIQPAGGGEQVFAHISVVHGERRPRTGDQVLFVPSRDGQGRLRAEHLRLAGELVLDRPQIRVKSAGKPGQPPRTRLDKPRARLPGRAQGPVRNLAAKLVLLGALCSLPLFGSLRWLFELQIVWPLVLYPLASVLCFVLYWNDKASALAGRQRIPEKHLHLVELLGGWPGALLGQQVFRHKTRKLSYQALFWLIVAAHQLFWLDEWLLSGKYLGHWLHALPALL
ncbi:DUF1294 domain-containing protein [Phytopseudomonas dryadis]|uniref:DUF1294 domain-containing protein n=1 Tax=Phytopseudomonas dryadis TaxID=2487520 RepID=A0ABY1ZEH9_9GAMM|nr:MULTISPECIES: DUF1294 domain-containing protein [Pseudomonas]TBV10154.1 DUF1294 domain-containing protein [Pseudomonas dryadis]TBV19015.1 DUF1294 domain-containing protein [Pseudomonas sp. FRB 230]